MTAAATGEPGYLTRMQRHLLHVHDEKLSRCTYCGEWVFDHRDCTACLLPHPAAAPLRLAPEAASA